nr:unnamed protein product [Digitaria exilis]
MAGACRRALCLPRRHDPPWREGGLSRARRHAVPSRPSIPRRQSSQEAAAVPFSTSASPDARRIGLRDEIQIDRWEMEAGVHVVSSLPPP